MTDHIESIARVCHEANRALCLAFGDASQPTWDEAPEWQKDSAKKGVQFHLDNPNAGPEASHTAWMADKEAAGWTWGEKKEPEAKKHPCMVPFANLPKEQQAKDHIFRAIVHAHAKPAACTIDFRDGDEEGEVAIAVSFFPNVKVECGKFTGTKSQEVGATFAQMVIEGMQGAPEDD